MIKTIIFDVDETLVPWISWTKLTEDLGASLDFHNDVYTQFKKSKLNLQEAVTKIIQNWNIEKRTSKKEITRIVRSWKLDASTSSTLKILSKKYNLVLISGSIEPFQLELSNRYNFQVIMPLNKFIWEKEKLINFVYSKNIPQKKLELFQQYLKQYNILASDCAMVGNDENDEEIFKNCGLPILINSTNSKLIKITKHQFNSVGDLLKIF